VESLQFVLPWVLACVLVGVAVGYYLGRSARTTQERQLTNKEREATLKALGGLLQATEQLNSDVDSHNTQIRAVGKNIVELDVGGEMRLAQHALLGQIASVLEANQKLEDDLMYARLQIESQAQEIDRTRKEARTDQLSGVANRKAFDEQLQIMLGAWRRKGRPFVLILADIDHFKWINDTHGHQAGDHVVMHIGEFLRKSIRDRDFVARFGGDEFAILLDNTELELGLQIAERIRSAVTKCNFGTRLSAAEAAITFSVGVSVARPDSTAESIVREADQALYQSKESGRNRVSYYEPPVEGSLATARIVS
jgi:diguanylate cyclase